MPQMQRGCLVDCEWIGWCVMKPEIQAAWVQAVGSVVAIAVAVAVPYFQRRGEKKRAKAVEQSEAVGLAMRIIPLLRADIAVIRERVFNDDRYFPDGEVTRDPARLATILWQGVEDLTPNRSLYDISTRASPLGELGRSLQTCIFGLDAVAHQFDRARSELAKVQGQRDESNLVALNARDLVLRAFNYTQDLERILERLEAIPADRRL